VRTFDALTGTVSLSRHVGGSIRPRNPDAGWGPGDGATWSAQVKLSDGTGGAPYKTAAGYAFPYGDYLDLAVTPTS
jgi:hypothetical protein